MAEAVQDLYPGTQVTIGPPIEDGFYYDFARNEPFHPEDLARIEARMAEIVAADRPFRREVVSRDEARRRFEARASTTRSSCSSDIPDGRADHALPPGRVVRSVPRAARAVDRADRRVQAAQDRRRLLAGRQPQRHAAAHLRHRLADQEAAGRLSAPPRGGGAARSPPARQGARSVPLPGGGAGRGVLASQGLDRLPRRSRPTSGAAWMPPATSRSGPRSCSIGRSGKRRAIGRSSASTCSRSRPSTRRSR